MMKHTAAKMAAKILAAALLAMVAPLTVACDRAPAGDTTAQPAQPAPETPAAPDASEQPESPETPTQPAQKRQCISWFDGCNSCSIKGGKFAICTERYCEPEEYTEYRCRAWKEN